MHKNLSLKEKKSCLPLSNSNKGSLDFIAFLSFLFKYCVCVCVHVYLWLILSLWYVLRKRK